MLDRYLTEVHAKKAELEGGFDRLVEDAAATEGQNPIFIKGAIARGDVGIKKERVSEKLTKIVPTFDLTVFVPIHT